MAMVLISVLDKAGISFDSAFKTANAHQDCARFETFYTLEAPKIQHELLRAAMHIAKSKDANQENKDRIRTSEMIVQCSKTRLEDHFKMDTEFLQAHTKSGIEALLYDSGWAESYEAQKGAATFKKFMQGKKDNILDEVKKSSFEFTGYVPACVRDRLAGKSEPGSVE